jgi:hypothetical protein
LVWQTCVNIELVWRTCVNVELIQWISAHWLCFLDISQRSSLTVLLLFR